MKHSAIYSFIILTLLFVFSAPSWAQQVACGQVPNFENLGTNNFDGCAGSGQLPLGDSTNHNFLTGGPGDVVGAHPFSSFGTQTGHPIGFALFGPPSGSEDFDSDRAAWEIWRDDQLSGEQPGDLIAPPLSGSEDFDSDRTAWEIERAERLISSSPAGFCMSGSSGCGEDDRVAVNVDSFSGNSLNFWRTRTLPPPSDLSDSENAILDKALESKEFIDHVGNETDYWASGYKSTTDRDVLKLYQEWKANGGKATAGGSAEDEPDSLESLLNEHAREVAREVSKLKVQPATNTIEFKVIQSDNEDNTIHSIIKEVGGVIPLS